jgi:hypothetical protein
MIREAASIEGITRPVLLWNGRELSRIAERLVNGFGFHRIEEVAVFDTLSATR